MKKRFGLFSLIGATVVLMALVGAITTLAAPSAAVTGTIKVDNAWYNITAAGKYPSDVAAGSLVKVTVTDADANVKTAASQVFDMDGITAALAITSTTITLTSGAEIVGTPNVLSTTKTDCSISADVDTDVNVSVFNASTGAIQIETFSGMANDTRTICFDKGQEDSVNVTVTSTQDPDGIKISATETGIDTGTFEVTITLSEDASTTTDKTLKSLDLDSITAKYKDESPKGGGSAVTLSATASVETGKPAFSTLLPVDALSTQEAQPTISGVINDVGGAGIDVSTIEVIIDGTNKPTVKVTGSDGDTSVTFSVTPAALTEALHTWIVVATDLAGNTGTSDADADTTAQDDHELTVDLTAPELTSADTGKYWDADATVQVEKQDKLDRVVVTFNDKIDSNTVSAADFTVEGIAPLAAEMPSKADKTKIYLTLANNLAADAEPVVTLAGTVSDLAGNSKTGGLATAKDEIAPTFTVTIDKTLIKAAEKAIISISADETIAGVPSVRVHNANGTDVSTLSVVVKTSKSWEATFAGSTTFENKNGVVIIGDDADPISNPGTEGKEDPTATGAIVITVDTIDPTITQWDAAGVNISGTDTDDVPDTSPFITVTFSEKVTVGKAEFGVKGGTLADVTAAGNLSDDATKWIYATSDLTVDGDYTISVEFTDTAGNDDDALVNFEVIEKALVAIALSPGMNLISLPSEPADSAINSVITVADVISVVAYDSQAGAFLSATRDADGKLSGTLTTMDAMHGYWVNSTSFEPIKVELPDPGFAAVPPSIPVTPGWNLVPVVSLTGQISGTTNADTYFGSTAWVTAYTFTPPSIWAKVLPNTFDTVTFGNGYWLYVSEAGILVP